MVGVKEICALLLAGGIGAGSVVTVQQAVPAVKKASAPKAGKPAARRPQAAARPAAINDCPSQLGVLGQNMALPALAPIDVAPGLPLGQTAMASAGGGRGAGVGVPGGGIGGTDFQPAPPADGGFAPGVPEPGTWAMLVGGFGLVGLAMRRGSRKPA